MTYRTNSEVVPEKGQVWRLPSGKLVQLNGRSANGVSWSWSGFGPRPGDYGFLDSLEGCVLVTNEGAKR